MVNRLLRCRIEGEDEGTVILPPLTVGDCWLLEGGHPHLASSDDASQHGAIFLHQHGTSEPHPTPRIPSAGSVDLLFLLQGGSDLRKPIQESLSNATLNPSSINSSQQHLFESHYLAVLLKKKFHKQSVLEINNNTLNLPLATLFRSLGVTTRVVLGEHIVTEHLANVSASQDPLQTSVARNELLEQTVASKVPGTGTFDFVRPFYWKAIVTERLSADALLDLTFRKHITAERSALVYIDPFRAEAGSCLRVPREYAELELNHRMPLLGAVILVSHGSNTLGDFYHMSYVL